MTKLRVRPKRTANPSSGPDVCDPYSIYFCLHLSAVRNSRQGDIGFDYNGQNRTVFRLPLP